MRASVDQPRGSLQMQHAKQTSNSSKTPQNRAFSEGEDMRACAGAGGCVSLFYNSQSIIARHLARNLRSMSLPETLWIPNNGLLFSIDLPIVNIDNLAATVPLPWPKEALSTNKKNEFEPLLCTEKEQLAKKRAINYHFAQIPSVLRATPERQRKEAHKSKTLMPVVVSRRPWPVIVVHVGLQRE